MNEYSSTFDTAFGRRWRGIIVDVVYAYGAEGLKERVRNCWQGGPVVQPGIPSVCWAEERPVCKFFTKRPEGRGSKSRPVHQMLFSPGASRNMPGS